MCTGGLRLPLYAAFRFDLINVCTVIRCLQILLIERERMQHGLLILGVRSRAETRASIAQNLEGENEGARDRVVTGPHLQIMYHSLTRIANTSLFIT
jgi:hypothetical protein